MTRSRDDSLRWAVDGATEFVHAIADLEREHYDAASLLPGWSRGELTAHVAANADALANLVEWARTGRPTPMYSSPEARAAGIARGTRMTSTALDLWVRVSERDLESAWGRLDEDHWSAQVVTAQGRSIAASEIPWLRARELWVHLVDLDLGYGFHDLPQDFLRALRVDVVNKRGDVPKVSASPPDELAWLTGRPHVLRDAPELPAWL